MSRPSAPLATRLSRGLLRTVLGRRLPTTRGRLTVDGVQDSVGIRRDAFGVPYIDAANDADAWYAVGFCQGQDRSFQLEGLLRAIRGTLAALFGPTMLPVDRLCRRVGFARAAAAQLAVLDGDVRAMLEAFTRGVNAGATIGRPRRSHEFVLLGATPTPWTAADVLGLMKLQAFLLAANWDAELARYTIWQQDGEDALRDLDYSYPEWLPVGRPPGDPAGDGLGGLTEELARLRGAVPVGGGSNAWAVASSRTKTGGALLANDPHLSSTLPPHWYLAHVRTPAWTAAGASFAGSPGFAVGHNAHGAWGATVSCTDNTDLYLEQLSADGHTVRGPGGDEACEVVDEVIEVKGGDAVTERVLITPRGPILSPALDAEVPLLSMRATWLEARPLRGTLDAHRSTDFDSFRGAFAQWPAGGLSFAYAGRDGTIGWQVTGDIPRRRSGHGWLPQPAWSDSGWHVEHVPFADNPHLRDPVDGFLATANNRPIPAAAEPFLTVDFVDGYRHARIRERLAERADWDLEAMAGLQLDQQCLPWRDTRDAVLAVETEGDARLAQEMLAAWDGRAAVESSPATVFELFVDNLARRVARDRAPGATSQALGGGFTPLLSHTIYGMQRALLVARCLRERPAFGGGWDWDTQIAAALGQAVGELRRRFGARTENWAWGRVRPLTMAHPLGRKWPLGHVYNLGPTPWGGDAQTVSPGSVHPGDPFASPGFVASLRMAVDVRDPSQNRYVLPGGQSGNPLSPNYDDQFDLWARGEAITMAWAAAEIESRAVERLELVPAADPQEASLTRASLT